MLVLLVALVQVTAGFGGGVPARAESGKGTFIEGLMGCRDMEIASGRIYISSGSALSQIAVMGTDGSSI